MNASTDMTFHIDHCEMKHISIHSTKQIKLKFQNSNYYTQVNNLESENKKAIICC